MSSTWISVRRKSAPASSSRACSCCKTKRRQHRPTDRTRRRIVGEVVGLPSTKTYIQHFKRRKNERRFRGHRQPFTAVKIKQIVLPA